MVQTLTEKTALITGASRGIGAAIFRALAEAGACVVGTATSAEGVEAINRSVAETGAGAGGGLCYNAGDGEQAGVLLKSAEEHYGAVDILVVNAAINADGLLLRMKPNNWQAVIDTNLTAAFLLSQAAVQGMMKKRWGRIVFISSVVASLGNAGQVNYCAAKAGLEGYCRAMAREVASRGITVNAVAPGFIETDMTSRLPAAVREKFTDNIPLGYAGQPADVAAAVCYLAGVQSGYVTGQVLHVNGGLYMG